MTDNDFYDVLERYRVNLRDITPQPVETDLDYKFNTDDEYLIEAAGYIYSLDFDFTVQRLHPHNFREALALMTFNDTFLLGTPVSAPTVVKMFFKNQQDAIQFRFLVDQGHD